MNKYGKLVSTEHHQHGVQVKDLHSWVSSNYFQRKGLPNCSPEELQTILYALDEEGQVMISADTNDLQIRFVM